MAKKKQIKAIEVMFGEDNVSALYLDGKLASTRDDYHGNGDFDSFIEGLRFAGKDVSVIESLKVNDESDSDDFPLLTNTNIPKVWPDDKWSELAE